MITIDGKISEIINANLSGGNSIYVVDSSDGARIVVVTGLVADVGDEIEATGEITEHHRHQGKLTAVSAIKKSAMSEDRFVAILCSGRMPGIGKGTALKIARALGVEKAIKAIESGDVSLGDIAGVGPKRAGVIIKGWSDRKEVDEGSIVIELQKLGLPMGVAKRVAKHFKGAALAIVRQSPYRLSLEVPGVGFKTADEIALSMGVSRNSIDRLKAGVFHVLNGATSFGDCGVPYLGLITKAAKELSAESARVREALDGMLAEDGVTAVVVRHGDVVYSKRLAEAEEFIAEAIYKMTKTKPAWADLLDEDTMNELIDASADSLGVKLAKQQREAVVMALSSRVSILTGGPGTGKTKTLQTIIEAFRRLKVTLAGGAPTGKAAKRGTETTGLEFSTIHRMLGLKGDDDTEALLTVGSLSIDEFSMMDVPLTRNVMLALSGNSSLLIVGDVEQLSSVGPGQVLSDFILSGVIPCTRLTEIFRQAAGSLIIRNAHRINTGSALERSGPDDDFFFLPVADKVGPEAAGLLTAQTIGDLVARRLPAKYGFSPMTDIQVLSPMNKGESGVIEMNRRLQSLLNPEPANSIESYGVRYGVGDRVIQTKNNYEFDIFNGDIGFIERIDKQAGKVVIVFSGIPIILPLEALNEIKLAFAMTIHKSQGSEAPCVVIPITMQHYTMLQRNLLYTGVTRGKALVVLVGQTKALEMAIKTNHSSRRVSRLKDLLVKLAA